jgi:small-conductance mechanosensitive channel
MGIFRNILDWFDQALAAFDPERASQAAIAAIVITIVVYVVFRIWRRLIRRFESRLETARESSLKPLRFQNMDLLSADDLASLFSSALRVAYWFGVTVLVLFNFNVVFGLFPATRGVVVTLINILIDTLTAMGETLVAYLPKLVVIFLTAATAYYAIRIARLVFHGLATRRITIKGFFPEWAMPTFGLVRLLITAVAFVLILPNLPAAHSPAFRGVSIFVAILLSLGSTAAVANMISGVVLTYTRAFKIGDLVRIADTLGSIQEKTLFVTRVKTPKNVEIAIPNTTVLANHIINYSSLARREPGLVLHTTITIGYDVPQEQVRTLLIEAAMATQNIEPEPEPFVLVTSLDDFYVSYEINAYTRQARSMPATYSELHGHIVDNFNKAGVEIMSPHYSAIRDGNPLALPKDHLPKNYEPAPFTFKPLEGLFGQKKKG